MDTDDELGRALVDIEEQKGRCGSFDDNDGELRECEKYDIVKMNAVLCFVVTLMTIGIWGVVHVTVSDEHNYLF